MTPPVSCPHMASCLTTAFSGGTTGQVEGEYSVASPGQHGTRRLVRVWALLAFAALLAGVAALTLWPNGWDINRLVVALYFDLGFWRLRSLLPLQAPGRFDFAELLNVLMTLVPAFLLVIAFPRLRWWWVALLGVAGSASVEATQGFILGGRNASLTDVVTNSTGAALGAWLGRRTDPYLQRRVDRSDA